MTLGATLSAEEQAAIRDLMCARAVRERSTRIFERALAGELSHFALDLSALPEAARLVAAVTRANYPDLRIPYHSRWNHFRAGGVDRVAPLFEALGALSPQERARALFDLVVVSVLLDAGAGRSWTYRDAATQQEHGRSEGLALASLRMFEAGKFSARPEQPLRADAAALAALGTPLLAEGFQVSTDNPLTGLEGRVELLRSLGRELARQDGENARVSLLYDRLEPRAGELAAPRILETVLEVLGQIWPSRLSIGGVNLGDVWRHPAAGGSGLSTGLVPFHKLSQWLSYSLVEPIESAGVRVVEVNELTGLPEYRNGGLFVDLGVLVPKHPAVTSEAHAVDSELVVEWRALTVALLDQLAGAVRGELSVGSDFTLAQVLEGGSWAAGRQLAQELRADGAPPIQVISDGTVF